MREEAPVEEESVQEVDKEVWLLVFVLVVAGKAEESDDSATVDEDKDEDGDEDEGVVVYFVEVFVPVDW